MNRAFPSTGWKNQPRENRHRIFISEKLLWDKDFRSFLWFLTTQMTHTCQDRVLKPQIAISLSPKPRRQPSWTPKLKVLRLLITSDDHQAPSITTQPQQKAVNNEILVAQPLQGGRKRLLVPSPLWLIPAPENSFLVPIPKRQQLALLQGAAQSTTWWSQGGSYTSKKPQRLHECGISAAEAQQAAVGRLCIRLGSLVKWKMEVSITQLNLKLEVCASHKSFLQKSRFPS